MTEQQKPKRPTWEDCYMCLKTEEQHIEQAKQQTALAIFKELDEMQEFFEADMWYASQHEWKEEDMIKYLKAHFDVVRKAIRMEKGK